MRQHSPEKLTPELREFFHSKLGLFYSEKQDEELLHKLKHAARAFGYHHTDQFADWLLETQLTDKQTGDLASHLTIGETYFFREKKSFDFLEQIYLPGLIRKRFDRDRHLRIWCAGCATGEEAYSLAIALTRTVPNLRDWDISIVATDINRIFLEKAQKGIYTKWSFRTNGDDFVHKYFTRINPREYQIDPKIKQMVKFSWFNLMGDQFPAYAGPSSPFDIVFCRNVLIYFSPEGNKRVTNLLYQSLAKGGILVVSPVEMMGIAHAGFGKINYSGFTIFQKGIHHKQDQHSRPVTEAPFSGRIPMPAPDQPPVPTAPPSTQVSVSLSGTFKTPSGNIPSKQSVPETAGEKENFETALSLFQQGLLQEAEAILHRLIRQAGTGSNAWLMLAKIKANQGKLHAAKQLCEKGILQDKLDQNLYYLLATIHQELGEDEQAVSLLKQALYLDPDFVLAHFLLGTLNLKLGNHDEGMKSFRRAGASLAQLNPEDILPDSDGMTVGGFSEMLQTIRK